MTKPEGSEAAAATSREDVSDGMCGMRRQHAAAAAAVGRLTRRTARQPV